MAADLPVPDDSLYELNRYAAMWDTDTPNDENLAVQLIAAPVVVRVLREQEAVIAALPWDDAGVMATRFRIRQQLLAAAQDIAAMVPPAEIGGIHSEGGEA